jgi:dethiobiotin synthetase
MRERKSIGCNLIYLIGTDTGVGKTLLTGFLLHHLRQSGCRALALKPFCSGGRGDARFLARLQPGELSLDQINAVFYKEPIAPGVAAKRQGRSIPLSQTVAYLLDVKSSCDCLLVEGAGGLLSPLGIDYTIADILRECPGEVVVVGRNRLGAINQVLLTIHELQRVNIQDITVVLMGQKREGLEAKTNVETLSEWLRPIRVMTVPYLGEKACQMGRFKNNYKKIQITLAQIPSRGNLYNNVRAKRLEADREEQ